MMSEWIKCSDRLPEHGVKVLIISDWSGYETDTLINGVFEYYKDSVTHWQPLPEPPTN